MDIHRLVSRIADALGTEADAAQVEAVATAALEALDPGIRPPLRAQAPDERAPNAAAGLDIRSLTLGISLRDCSSRLPQTVRARVYDKIRRAAAHLAAVSEDAAARHGVPIGGRSVSVTPISLIADGLSRDELIGLAQLLDTAAEHVGVSSVSGFSALVERGMTHSDRALLDALPAALSTTTRVGGSVNCGASAAGLNVEAVFKAAEVIQETARLTADRGSAGCSRLVTCCNASQGYPFGAGAFYGTGGAEAAVAVEVSASGLVLGAVREAGPDACFGSLFEAVRQAASESVQAGAFIGRECAERLSRHSGISVAFGGASLCLAPSSSDGASFRDILLALGLEEAGAPGATAALALLDEALRQGVLTADGGGASLSSAFRPVSAGFLLDRREAPDAVCAAGPGTIAIPGDTPVESVAGILLDACTLGLIHNETTETCLIPVHGKHAGDRADLGDRLGVLTVLPVSPHTGAVFARRGGRLPAPVRPSC